MLSKPAIQIACSGLLCALFAVASCSVDTDEGTISVRSGSEAASMLRALGLPENASDVSEIEERGPDGPMPEIAIRYFTVAGTADEIRRDFVRRCADAGLGEPDAEMVETDPSALCTGRSDSVVSHVFLEATCADQDCAVSVEVRMTRL